MKKLTVLPLFLTTILGASACTGEQGTSMRVFALSEEMPDSLSVVTLHLSSESLDADGRLLCDADLRDLEIRLNGQTISWEPGEAPLTLQSTIDFAVAPGDYTIELLEGETVIAATDSLSLEFDKANDIVFYGTRENITYRHIVPSDIAVEPGQVHVIVGNTRVNAAPTIISKCDVIPNTAADLASCEEIAALSYGEFWERSVGDDEILVTSTTDTGVAMYPHYIDSSGEVHSGDDPELDSLMPLKVSMLYDVFDGERQSCEVEGETGEEIEPVSNVSISRRSSFPNRYFRL